MSVIKPFYWWFNHQGNPKFQSLLRCQKLHQCYNKPTLVWVNIVLILEIHYIKKNLNLYTERSPAVPHPHHRLPDSLLYLSFVLFTEVVNVSIALELYGKVIIILRY